MKFYRLNLVYESEPNKEYNFPNGIKFQNLRKYFKTEDGLLYIEAFDKRGLEIYTEYNSLWEKSIFDRHNFRVFYTNSHGDIYFP